MLWPAPRQCLNRSEREGSPPPVPPTPEDVPARVKVREQRKQTKFFEKTQAPPKSKKLCERKPAVPKPANLSPSARKRVDETKARRTRVLAMLELDRADDAEIQAKREAAAEQVLNLTRTIEAGIGPEPFPEPRKRVKPRLRKSIIKGMWACLCLNHCGVGATRNQAYDDWKQQSEAS